MKLFDKKDLKKIRWYRDLYLGDSVKGSLGYYRFVINHTKRLTGLYCILPGENDGGMLDIVRCDLVRTGISDVKEPFIIGLAGSKREAMELTGSIVSDVIAKTGSSDVKGFFNSVR
ncbi:MAG: hypothetical protein K5637_06700 [Lachnospiraceae bacterium]|nr:hypothetical protein [Lachnospiraceae bacterium]